MNRNFVKDYKKTEGEQPYTYVGDYYIFSMEEKEKKKHSLYQILFAVLQLLLLVAAGLLNSPGSYKVYIVLPYLCMVLPLFYYIMGSAGMAKVPQRMEGQQHEKTLFRCFKSIVALFLLSVLTVCVDAVFFFKNRKEIGNMPEGLFLGIMLLMAVMNYAALVYQHRLQKSVVIEPQKQEKQQKQEEQQKHQADK